VRIKEDTGRLLTNTDNMALFQKSVEKKYLNELNQDLIDEKYQKFLNYFGNSEIQENIRNSKEEEFQSEFIRELFVNILDYTLKPNPGFNIVLEKKNVDDSKKADGAILSQEEVIVVIELKSTDTRDLDSVETQAFGYKNHHPKCKYIITSNFEKLRFYIHNALDKEEFDLFNMSIERFSLMWLCLSKDNVLSNLPSSIKEASVLKEKDVTKELYADYSVFRKDLFENILKNNPKKDKLLLFKKVQKLLDRFLFIFFAEDRLLLPPNSISEIIDQWESQSDWGDDIKLYDRYKKYFDLLNTGWKGKKHEIFAYNGGLFAKDEILDNLVIDDDILKKHTLKLSGYNFNPESTAKKESEKVVDVNILGHIFEHSLSEIENVQAEIRGEEIDKSKTKRKKDGIFYTPKYITKYIVDNTVGKLCEEKKTEIGIIDEEYAKGRKNRKKEIVKKLDNNLKTYRDWLLNITICDPACGSGAFLNQALEFLINEHAYIDELQAQLFGASIIFQDVNNHILENNIYGVDINEESVDIAKLSLWLRTAQKGRRLSTLSSNLKCGNSLIDDPEIAGEKAFNWQKEFPSVFVKGGFDVVIGNPPYVSISTLPKFVHHYFKKDYGKIHTGYNDLMYYFLYKGIGILNEQGTFGMITSNYFIGNEYAKSLRNFLSNHISEILNFSDYLIFEDANVHTAIIFAEKKQKCKTIKYNVLIDAKESILSINPIRFDTIKKDRNALKEYWVFASNDKNKIIEKIYSRGKLLGKISEIEKGSTSGKNDVFTISKETVKKYGLESEQLRKNVKNGDITKYGIYDRETYLIYTDKNTEIEKYPNILNYLKEHQEVLAKRNEVKKGGYEWWRLERPRRIEIFDAKEKLIVPYRATENRFAYDNEQRFNDGGDIRAIVITNREYLVKYVLGVLNSRLIDWYFGFIGKPKGNSREYFNEPLAKIPVFKADEFSQRKISELVDDLIRMNQEIQLTVKNFSNLLNSKYTIKKLSAKLQNWYELEFGEFLKELKKAKVQLSIGEEAEWMQYFGEQKQKAQELKAEIDKTDKAIDKMVYELYGLSEEEIKIVEKS